MKLTVEIDSDNDAMQSSFEAVRLLKRVIKMIENEDNYINGRLMDENGNTVGRFEFDMENG